VTVARTKSVAVVGITGQLVDVEADISNGVPGLTVVGLPDTAVQQARERVKAAIVNSRAEWPKTKITVNLSPAALPKRGSAFDVSIAVAILIASGDIAQTAVDRMVLLAELGLDGRLRPVGGVLPAVLGAATAGIERVVVAPANAEEAGLVPDVDVLAVGSLLELRCRLRQEPVPDDLPDFAAGSAPPPASVPVLDRPLDLADVLGQAGGRRAMEVAAAGGHHVLLSGDPGSGKTMLAERLPGLLPPLDRSAALEVTAVHSVAGVLAPDHPLVTRPPYCDVHHTASVVSVIGGGSGVPRPGAVSIAHRGVLFMDEAAEFQVSVLEALRQPLESGIVVVARAGGIVRYPAKFTLVLASNPCPCAAVVGRGEHCQCTPMARRRYATKLSGPLLDRIDLRVTMCQLTKAELLADRDLVETSAVVADRVAAARDRAARRLAGTPWRVNGDVPGPVLRRRWPPDPAALERIRGPLDRGLLSARALDRVVRVAWTLADLAGVDRPGEAEIGQAMHLRLSA
jgi:magnesium chelatase family protein